MFEKEKKMAHTWNHEYTDENLNKVAFPLGGIGAGMICLDGNGSFSHVSVRNQIKAFHIPLMFGAISVKEGEEWKARVVQGRTADWKVMHPWGEHFQDSASGARDTTLDFHILDHVHLAHNSLLQRWHFPILKCLLKQR